MTEIASAYVALTVKAPGIKRDVEAALDQVDGEKAGKKAGDGIGRGLTAKQAAIAGAVGGIFAQVTNMAAQALGNLVGEAIQASDATDKFKQTLSFAGLDTSAIDVAMKRARAYADATVYDLSTIQNTTAQLAANGIQNYSELTEAAGNLNAVAGGNADTFNSVAMMLTQTAGAGKLTTENWNQLADAIPGASGRLQDALRKNGAFVGDFRDAMAKGEITADEFNAALLELGSEPVAQEAATSVSTMEGAVGNLQAAIVGGLADAFTAIKPLLTDLINGAAEFVTWIQENVHWLGPLAAGIGIAVGAVIAWSVAQWALNAALTANPIGLIIVAIGLLIGAIILLVQNWDEVVKWLTDVWGGFVAWLTGVLEGLAAWWNDLWAGIGKWIQDVWAGFISWITGVLNGFVAWWNNLWAGVGKWISDVWNGIVSGVTGYFKNLQRGLQIVGDAIAGWWNNLWSGVGRWISDVWNGIVTGITGYFQNLYRGLQIVGGAISSWWNGLWSGVGSFFRGVWDGILGAIRNVQNVFGSVFNAIAGIVRGAFNGVVSVVRGVVNTIVSIINGIINGINAVVGTVGDALGFSVRIPNIPHLAQGGVVLGSHTGTLAVVGEGGPGRDEAVVPLPDGWRHDGFGGESRIAHEDMRLLAVMVAEALRGVRRADGVSAQRATMQGVR